ncbi:MAG: hypothetical protein SO179_04155 [Bacteroidales bacterium]|nr:hypothetical protein [Bacteroidales bacterium]
MFNQIYKVKNNCTLTTVYIGEFSYIKAVKWDEFMANKNDFIEKAIRIKENINDYEICKSV